MSIASGADQLAAVLKERIDDDLRAVTAYWHDDGGQGFEVVHHHCEVDTTAERIQYDEAAREMIIDLLSKDDREDSFDLGSLTSTVYFFDEATVVNFYVGDGAGIAFSVEPDSAAITRSFLERCRTTVGPEAQDDRHEEHGI